MNTQPLITERTFDAPVEKVWEAITDKNQMKQWYFDIKEFKPEVGFEFSFTAGSETKKYVHVCKITAVEKNKKLAYTWCYEGYPGNSLVTFELFAEGDKTKVKLTHEGLETFGGEGDFATSSFNKGWTHIIGTSLKNFVEGK